MTKQQKLILVNSVDTHDEATSIAENLFGYGFNTSIKQNCSNNKFEILVHPCTCKDIVIEDIMEDLLVLGYDKLQIIE